MPWICTACNDTNTDDLKTCAHCGIKKPFGAPTLSSTEPAHTDPLPSPDVHTASPVQRPKVSRETSVVRRYSEAYLVARSTAGLGKAISFLGQACAGCGVLGLLGGLAANPLQDIRLALLIPLGIAALPVGLLFYCLGVLIGAHGQMLKATLDSAINSSPFLSDDQKATAMSI
jgi:hypothetical protein